jgi:hypothetical protein
MEVIIFPNFLFLIHLLSPFFRVMPIHNGLTGHDVWADNHSKLRRNNQLREYMIDISRDGKTVTCYIATETGRFFAGTWWWNVKMSVMVQPYTAEVVRDGESVCFYGFGRKMAGTIRGIGLGL